MGEDRKKVCEGMGGDDEEGVGNGMGENEEKRKQMRGRQLQ